MPLRLAWLFLLLCLPTPARAQQPLPSEASWLDTHALRLRSIHPEYADDADLDQLVHEIGDKRIVVLAERSAGDGATLLAKTRLSRRLIKTGGFSVILFEAGFYDCRAMNAQFAAGTDYSACAPLGLPADWAQSGLMSPLYRQVWTSYFGKRPVDVGGFDHRATGRRTARQLPRELLDYLDSIDPHPFDKDQRRHMLTVLERLDEAARAQDDKAIVQAWQDLHQLAKALSAHAEALIAATSPMEHLIWTHILEDQIENARAAMAFEPPAGTLRDDNRRQAHMGDRLVWLAGEVYPDRKIIVWCSSLTALHDAADIRLDVDQDRFQGFLPAGAKWREALGEQMYVIGFDAARGLTARLREQPLPELSARAGSLEQYFARIDWPFLFVPLHDLEGSGLDQAMPGNLICVDELLPADDGSMRAHVATARWSEHFNAVFFIRTMFPNSFDKPPEGAVHTVDTE
ncbi:MAG: erythromycin esterase family protein [Phycisphaerales bacterium]|nr:erythromycin esterase family protein [Phycisphaerales bacterium]